MEKLPIQVKFKRGGPNIGRDQGSQILLDFASRNIKADVTAAAFKSLEFESTNGLRLCYQIIPQSRQSAQPQEIAINNTKESRGEGS